VVVVDGGKLLRSSSTTDFTQTTTTLAIEVTDTDEHPDGTRAVREALHARGVSVEAGSGLPGAGHILLLTAQGEETYDVVRDVVADLGLGLVRMEQRRHHISEVFKDDQETEEQQRKEAVGHGS
jgi:ABC-2 type transport system ATP-binding protein